jgi:hypothetical protein
VVGRSSLAPQSCHGYQKVRCQVPFDLLICYLLGFVAAYGS